MLSAEKAKEFYQEELADFGFDDIKFWDSSVGTKTEIVARYIGVNIPEKGNKAVIDFLLKEGFVKERRVSSVRSYGTYVNREPKEFIVQLKLDVLV